MARLHREQRDRRRPGPMCKLRGIPACRPLPITVTANGAQRHGEARTPPKGSLATVSTVGRRYLQNNLAVTGTAQSAQGMATGEGVAIRPNGFWNAEQFRPGERPYVP